MGGYLLKIDLLFTSLQVVICSLFITCMHVSYFLFVDVILYFVDDENYEGVNYKNYTLSFLTHLPNGS